MDLTRLRNSGPTLTVWPLFNFICISKINLVGINYKDNINNAKAFLNELGNPYSKILSDKDGVTSIELGAYGVPETFLINKEKVIIKKIIGPINNERYKEILNLIK